MRKYFLLPLLALACLTACSSDDDEATPDNSTKRPLTVEVTENPMVDENGTPRKTVTTRGTEITTSSLSSFSMNYQNNKYDFSKTGSTWNTNTWPSVENDTKIDFYAYNGGTFNYNSGSPYLNFTVEDYASNQKDLLVATHKQISYNDAGGKVTLAFDHVCAAVKFRMCIISGESGINGHTILITSVVLNGAKKSGTYHYDTATWDEVSTVEPYTLTTGSFTPATYPTYTTLPCGYLFLIPQTKEGLSLTISYTDGGTEKSKNYPLTGTWQTGYEYTVNIYVGASFINSGL
ncbi:MAG: fimbrillin family protein [Bacteroidaceae bacterium]|nr:fimbrillin family protein [Bacteroidaceae bacterium]